MPDVCLIHWKTEEAAERIARLRAAGFAAAHVPITGSGAFRAICDTQPRAIVIDLSRLPSHGRETAIHMRMRKPTRHVPIVFVGGDPEKVQRLRALLPDATYTDWPRIKSALKSALKQSATRELVVPKDGMAGYSGTPLPKKLGIKPNAVVSLVSAPDDFVTTTLGGDCPPGVRFIDGRAGKRDLTLWFLKSTRELTRGLPRAVAASQHGPVWFAWPKKASGVPTDLAEQAIRDAGLAAGLVDYKICAIDATWSGLLFALRKNRKNS